MKTQELSLIPHPSRSDEMFLRVREATPVKVAGFTKIEDRNGFVTVPAKDAQASLESAQKGEVVLTLGNKKDARGTYPVIVLEATPVAEDAAVGEGTLAHN